jgi:predicted nucleotidyltransferase
VAQVPDRIIKILKRYVAELEKTDIHLKAAILFGSYATGNCREFSDIDIALVSDDFEGVRFFDKEKIKKPTLAIDHRIEPLPFRTENFSEDNVFVKEILKTGIRVI